MRKLLMFVITGFFLLTFIAQNVNAPAVLEARTYAKEYNRSSNTVMIREAGNKSMEIQLVDLQTTLTSFDAYFRIRGYQTTDAENSSEEFRFIPNLFRGRDVEIEGIYMDVLVNKTYRNVTQNCRTVVGGNGTVTQCNPRFNGFYDVEEKVQKKVNFQKLRFEKDVDYYFHVKAYRSGGLGIKSADIMPRIKGLDLPEFVWWNTSYNTRVNVTFDNYLNMRRTPEIIYYRLEHNNTNTADCSGIDVSNETDNGPLPFNTTRISSTVCDVRIQANISSSFNGTIAHIYYDNQTQGAGIISRLGSLPLLNDTFADGNAQDNSTGYNWSGTVTVSGGIASFFDPPSSGTNNNYGNNNFPLYGWNNYTFRSRINFPTDTIGTDQEPPFIYLYVNGTVSCPIGNFQIDNYFGDPTLVRVASNCEGFAYGPINIGSTGFHVVEVFYTTYLSTMDVYFDGVLEVSATGSGITTIRKGTIAINGYEFAAEVDWVEVIPNTNYRPINATTGGIVEQQAGAAAVITINNPQNITYAVTNLSLNVSSSSVIDKWWYILNSGSNITFLPNTTIIATEGFNNLTVYANDTTGQLSSKAVNFTVDTISPTLLIDQPQNKTYGTINLSLFVNYTELRPDKFWYILNSGSNTSFIPNTTIIAVSGFNNLTVHMNDTAGNRGSASVNFTLDTAGPIINLISPTNTTFTTGYVPFIYEVSDSAGVSRCWYSLNAGSNITITGCLNFTATLDNGFYALRFSANDTFGNITDVHLNFTVSYVLLNVTALDEETGGIIYNFTVIVTDNEAITVTNTTTNGFAIFRNLTQLPDGTYTVMASAIGYSDREYYVSIINSSTNYLSVYLLNSSSGTTVLFQAVNVANVPLQGAILNIQRFLNGTWTVIGSVQTDSTGTASMIIDTSVTLRGIGTASGYQNVSRTFSSATTQPIVFVFSTTSQQGFQQWILNAIDSQCTKYNTSTTRNIYCTANDTSGLATSYQLVVNEIFRNVTSIVVCTKTNTTVPYATLNCSLPMDNQTFSFRLMATISSSSFQLEQGTWDFTQRLNFGIIGVFVTLMLFIICSLIGIWNERIGPQMGVVFGYVAIAIMWGMGFINLGEAAFTGVISLGLIAAVFALKMSY